MIPAKQRCSSELWIRTLIGISVLGVEPKGCRNRTVTKSGRTGTTPLQKHSLGDCTIDMLPSNCRFGGKISFWNETEHDWTTLSVLFVLERVVCVSWRVHTLHCKSIHGCFVAIFHILTEPVPYTLVAVNRRNNEARAGPHCKRIRNQIR